ncbi:hypothetical protein FB645_004676 [Coemansia sp. IMI 203386]|nr:hypothetical protein FB645_004676 [Coemansia sp. IMI 203386]
MLSTSASRHFHEKDSDAKSDLTIVVSEAQTSETSNSEHNDSSDDSSLPRSLSLSLSPAVVPRVLPREHAYQLLHQLSASASASVSVSASGLGSGSGSGSETEVSIDEMPIYTSTINWSLPIGPDDFLYRQQLSQLRLRKQGITRVSIIDFDNTLFKSPLPNTRLWDSSLIGMLKSTDLGWFQDSRTLSPPYLEYTDSHWISTIETLTRLEAARPDTLVMLLTGRSHAAYRNIILDLLEHRKGLQFDIVILKETPTRLSPLVAQTEFCAAPAEAQAPLTFDYKMAVVEDTIAAFPEITEIVMWDDRSHQCQKMQDYLNALQARSDKITRAHVNHVPPQTIFMREENERRLVGDMIHEYNSRVRADAENSGLLNSRSHPDQLPVGSIRTTVYPSYTGVFLGRKGRALLQKHVHSPRGWARASSHMPLAVGRASPQELESMVGAQLGDHLELVADAIGTLKNSVIAVRISHVRINGKEQQLLASNFASIPYITVAYNRSAGFKSEYASNIKTWRPLRSGALVLEGVVKQHTVTGAQIVKQQPKIADEVSIGALVCQAWPRLKGKDIGVAVASVRAQMKEKDVANLESNRGTITDIVKSLFST